MSESKRKMTLKPYLCSMVMTVVWFSIASLIFTFILKNPEPVPVFVIFCIIQIISMIGFALITPKLKTGARLFSMLIIGSFLFFMAGIMSQTNIQLEGFFFAILSGTINGAIVHFAMAKIIGPLFYNRNWCSWGCWTSLVLDLLPYKTNVSWKRGFLTNIRYYHFVLSFIIVAGVFFGFRYAVQNTGSSTMFQQHALPWFLAGNLLYYILGISLAFIVKDNRAFCKYVCPLTVFYKTIGRVSLLRIKGNQSLCKSCRECVSKCPMAIDIPEYIRDGKRVTSSECILCMNCIAACPNHVLSSSVGFDISGSDFVNYCKNPGKERPQKVDSTTQSTIR